MRPPCLHAQVRSVLGACATLLVPEGAPGGLRDEHCDAIERWAEQSRREPAAVRRTDEEDSAWDVFSPPPETPPGEGAEPLGTKGRVSPWARPTPAGVSPPRYCDEVDRQIPPGAARGGLRPKPTITLVRHVVPLRVPVPDLLCLGVPPQQLRAYDPS